MVFCCVSSAPMFLQMLWRQLDVADAYNPYSPLRRVMPGGIPWSAQTNNLKPAQNLHTCIQRSSDLTYPALT